MTAKEIIITATSSGYIGGNKAQILMNGRDIGFDNTGRGLNIAVFDETTGQPLLCSCFDTSIGNGEMFARVIDRVPEGRIVAIAVKGDAGSLSDRAKQACQSLGSAYIDYLQAYQSYTLIGIRGGAPGTAAESIDWLETSSSSTFEVETAVESAFTVSATSVPAPYNYSEIALNGSAIAGGNSAGLNAAAIDRASGQIKATANFNIAADPNQIAAFVQFIEERDAGEIVALSTKGDVSILNYFPQGKQACHAIGSTLIDDALQYGGSWAIVGYKGAQPGQAVENLDNIGQYLGGLGEGVRVKYWSNAAAVRQDLSLQKLRVDGASAYFGYYQSVGIEGDYALVGDIGKDRVYGYRWQGDRWQNQEQLEPQGQQGGNFGIAVDLCGNFAIVGQSAADVSSNTDAGAAHIYELKEGRWQHQQMLQPSDLKGNDFFGISVAIEGIVAIVGAYYADAPGKTNCGAVYIFQLENGTWVQKTKLQPSDLSPGDSFGYRVGIYGDVAIATAHYADATDKTNCGAAYIFHLKNGAWQQQQKLQPTDLGASNYFGSSVAVVGNWAIVGATHSDIPGKNDVGAAYIYQLQEGTWQLHQKIQAADPNAGDNFGKSVAIGGDVAVVGAAYADASGKANCGAAYLFELVEGQWQQKQKLQPSDLPAHGNWGSSTSFDGSKAIVGGYGGQLTPKNGFAYSLNTVDESSKLTIQFRFSGAL